MHSDQLSVDQPEADLTMVSGTGYDRNAVPVLDDSIIAELRDMGSEDGSDFLGELVNAYQTSASELIEKLRCAVSRKNADALRQAAHTLKSASGILGALRITPLCGELETLGRNGVITGADALLNALETEYWQAAQAFRTAVGKMAGGAKIPARKTQPLPRILVVDDDITVRKLAQQALGQAGFQVTLAADGEEALAFLDKARPELVLLDVEMPRLDGFATCAAMRRRLADKLFPILMVTGFDDLDSIARAYEAGATDFVSKPINWMILTQRLRYMLRASRLTQALAKREASLATAQRLAQLGNWAWDRHTGIVEYSDELYHLFGLAPGSVPASLQTLLACTDKDDRRRLKKAILTPLKTGQTSNASVSITHADGGQRTLLIHTEAVTDDAGYATQLLGTFQDITERRQTEAKIRNLAYFDNLTGLPNRRHFHERTKRELALAQHHGRELAILFLDLDDFKRINETLGHTAGDCLLKTIAQRLCTTLHVSGTISRKGRQNNNISIARLGGDEFVVLLSEFRHSEDAAVAAVHLLEALSRPIDLSGRRVSVTSSIGIAIYPNDGTDIDSLFKNADTAMYHAKKAGKNAYQFYDEAMNAAALQRLTLEQELRCALDNNELALHYQPQIQLASNTVVGVEALLRWHNPRLGHILPAEFISLAEETGLIVSIGAWAIKTACAQAKIWQDQGLPALRIAVNLSARQFAQPALPELVAKILAETGLMPRHLELELTESMLMQDVEQAVQTMTALKDIGIRLAIDDFGTGYSSLSHLRQFPIDQLKIDRSFVHDISANPDNAAIALAVVSMAHSLHLSVVAEGVETEAQYTFLQHKQCDEVQGYFLCHPLPPDDLTTLLQAQQDRGFDCSGQ